MTTKPDENDDSQALVTQAEAGDLQPTSHVGAMLEALLDKDLTADHAVVLDKLGELYLKDRALQAQQAFAAAKAALQAELPTVAATRVIPDNQGNVRSTFAAYEDIMEQVKPYLVGHGFSVSFTMKAGEGRMEAVCTLTHSQGHSESNSFSVRVGKGPPKCSEAQSDGAARSYARRGALCDALNIVVDKDTDARLEGACISKEKAADLMKGAEAAGIAAEDFLRLAGADSFEEIREAKLSVLQRVLREKASQHSLEGLKKAWAKARYEGRTRPAPAAMRATFREWAESVLQRGVEDIDNLQPAEIASCVEWLKASGASPRPDEDAEPGSTEPADDDNPLLYDGPKVGE